MTVPFVNKISQKKKKKKKKKKKSNFLHRTLVECFFLDNIRLKIVVFFPSINCRLAMIVFFKATFNLVLEFESYLSQILRYL